MDTRAIKDKDESYLLVSCLSDPYKIQLQEKENAFVFFFYMKGNSFFIFYNGIISVDGNVSS